MPAAHDHAGQAGRRSPGRILLRWIGWAVHGTLKGSSDAVRSPYFEPVGALGPRW